MIFKYLNASGVFVKKPLLRSHLFHSSDSSCDGFCRTDQKTEMTSHTLFRVEYRPPVRLIETDRLMAAVIAADVTSSAADALFVSEFRIQDRISFQFVKLDDVFFGSTDQLIEIFDVPFPHIAFQAGSQIINDPIAVLHDGRRDL